MEITLSLHFIEDLNKDFQTGMGFNRFMESIKRLRLMGRYYQELLLYNLTISLIIQMGLSAGGSNFMNAKVSAKTQEEIFVAGYLALFISFGYALACAAHFKMQASEYYFYFNARLGYVHLWGVNWFYNLFWAWLLYQVYVYFA